MMKKIKHCITVAFVSVFFANMIGGYLLLDDLYFSEWRIQKNVSGYTVFIRTDFIRTDEEIIEKTNPEKTNPEKTNPYKTQTGSGFVLRDEGKFYIVTADHVVNRPNAKSYALFRGKKKYHKVKVVGWDKIFDLALLEFEEKKFIPPGYIESWNLTRKLNSGDTVFISGNPLFFKFISSKGRIMKPKVYIPGANIGSRIAIDANCNPGNSGGPVITKKGKLAGIVISTTPKIYSNNPICLAVPARILKMLLPKLRVGGEIKHGMVGIILKDSWNILPHERKVVGLENFKDEGVVITKVIQDSPADKAGLKLGDIILSFGRSAHDSGFEVREANILREELNLHFFAGDTVVFRINRYGNYLIKKIKILEPPELLIYLLRESWL